MFFLLDFYGPEAVAELDIDDNRKLSNMRKRIHKNQVEFEEGEEEDERINSISRAER